MRNLNLRLALPANLIIIDYNFPPASTFCGTLLTKRAQLFVVTPPNTAEYDEIRHEIKQETPTEEVHGNEVVTSSTPELHESETTVSVTGPREYEETVIVVPKLELVTAESAISDAVSTHVQDSEPTNAVPENLSINVQGKIMFGFVLNRA